MYIQWLMVSVNAQQQQFYVRGQLSCLETVILLFGFTLGVIYGNNNIYKCNKVETRRVTVMRTRLNRNNYIKSTVMHLVNFNCNVSICSVLRRIYPILFLH